MKIIGLLLIVGALVGGGIILSDTIPGYLRNKDYLARAEAELRAETLLLDKVSANARASELEIAIRRTESATENLRFAVESVERRRNESLLFGGGAVGVLALGTFLFMRGRRKSGVVAAPATALT